MSEKAAEATAFRRLEPSLPCSERSGNGLVRSLLPYESAVLQKGIEQFHYSRLSQ
jgi:hypothetical protein